jgi:sulfide:quinone oxidoreductase
VVLDSGLAPGGWAQVDQYTLATPYDGVYALGDVANAPVPRAGVFAERAAGVVADGILARLNGGEVTPYDGYGLCYIDFGGEQVARVEITFITADGPQGGPFTPPSAEVAAEKNAFGVSRLKRWLGRELTSMR